jgi:hypothetical protein
MAGNGDAIGQLNGAFHDHCEVGMHADHDNHDQTLLTIKIQEAMAQAVLNVCKDAYPPMIPTHTYTTVTEKNYDKT